MAIGLLDGTVVLHNLKTDKELFRVHQQHKVSAIAFRTDGTPMMVTAGMSGALAIWDLDERRVLHVVQAHDQNVHTCFFYSGMHVLLTASADNSIKMWVFDSLDHMPRLLKSRSGHHKPPTMIKHYGEDGHTILSAGQDQALRSFSVIRDEQQVELSQGSLSKKAKQYQVDIDTLKLPQAIDFACNSLKQKDWDTIISCHHSSPSASVWSHQRKAIGKHQITSPDGSDLKAVAVSECGHFGFVGSALGQIDRFNMQSGLFRCSYKGHTRAVTAIISNNVNSIVMSSSLDKTLKFWDFHTGALLDSLDFASPISHLCISHSSGLLAVVCDDLSISVVDTDSKRTVRKFTGHLNRITGITWSPDSKWLISASLDSTVKTWDLPTGALIDCFGVKDIPTSVSMSPTGDFLATTHVNHVGVFLWANRTMYEHVAIRPMQKGQVHALVMPITGGSIHVSTAEPETPEINDELMWNICPTDDLIVFSELDRSRWLNLLSLDAIKLRNKPVQPPKAPEQAPFFLETTRAAIPEFVVAKEPAQIANAPAEMGESSVASTLAECHANEKCNFFVI